MQKRVYVWEKPLRFTHWLGVLNLLVLSVTGFYIGNPFLHATSADQYIMGWMRFLHFTFAYIFVINIFIRIYWSFVGNEYANWRVFFPYSGKRLTNVFQVIQYYALIKKKPPYAVGHTELAGVAYFVLLLIYVFQIFTGFALYSTANPGGFLNNTFGWMFSLFTIPYMRLYHHLVMWFTVCFTILHVYNGILLNSVEKNNILGSIFDGYKLIDTEKAE